MKKNAPYLLFFLFIFFQIYTSCKKDDDCQDAADPLCSNYDPCLGAVETDADFGFYSRQVGHDTVYWFSARDTVYSLHGARIYFRAHHAMESYEWKVGSDPRVFRDSVFDLDFDENIQGNIVVRLIVTNGPKTDCFPRDDGRDTVSKSFYLKPIDELKEVPMFGKFKGHDEGYPDIEFVVEISPEDAGLRGLPNDCDVFYAPPWGAFDFIGWQWDFIIDPQPNYACGDPEGEGHVSDDRNTLTIEYSLEDSLIPEVRHDMKFIGTRIQ